jgi:hypothetical protein
MLVNGIKENSYLENGSIQMAPTSKANFKITSLKVQELGILAMATSSKEDMINLSQQTKIANYKLNWSGLIIDK